MNIIAAKIMKLFNGNDIDWKAYTAGQIAYSHYKLDNLKTKNPFSKNTDKWYSWNRGWNEA